MTKTLHIKVPFRLAPLFDQYLRQNEDKVSQAKDTGAALAPDVIAIDTSVSFHSLRSGFINWLSDAVQSEIIEEGNPYD